MTAKIKRYIEEIRHCWRLGAGVGDRTSLAFDTLMFHLENAKGRHSWSESEGVRHCRIRLPYRLNLPVDFCYRLRGGDLFILHEVLLNQCYQIPQLPPESVRS